MYMQYSRRQKYPLNFPFNLHYEKIKDAFGIKNSSIRELKTVFNYSDFILKNIFYSGIPLSSEQIDLLLDLDTSKIKEYFNVSDIGELNELELFCEKSDIKTSELQELLFSREKQKSII